MTSKPFDFAGAQEAYLRDKWGHEFYEGVETRVNQMAIPFHTLMEIQHYIVGKERGNKNLRKEVT